MALPLGIVIHNGIFVALCLLIVILGLLCIALWKNLLPFPDRGSFICTCRSLKSRDDLIKILYGKFKVRPRFQHDTPLVKRVIYGNGVILNVVNSTLLSEMGNPSAGLAFAVENPKQTAREVCNQLVSFGYGAKVHTDPEMDGKVYFVQTDALLGTVLVFRVPLIKMGKPQKWGK